MLNYIVDDLEALLDRLAKEGVHIDTKLQDEYGRFAWIYDPDGNKIDCGSRSIQANSRLAPPSVLSRKYRRGSTAS